MPKTLLLAVLGLAVVSWALLSAAPIGATGNRGGSLHETGYSSSLALDNVGTPVVSFFGNVIYGEFMFPYGRQVIDGDLKVLRCSGPNCEGVLSSVAVDSAGEAGQFPSLELDPSDNPVVSYYDLTNGNLKVIHCGNYICTAGNTISTPDATGNIGQWTSLELDSAGHPVVSYYDATNGDLKLLHCGDATCSAGNSIASPDTAGDVGLHTSLVLDSAGHPVISYHDGTTADLKVLHCGNAACTAGNSIVSPDTAGNVGEASSIALDSAGYPVVSYQDYTNVAIKVLHCGDATCSTGNSIASLDAGNVAESSTSALALDSGGNPVVSYLTLSGGITLAVLHCGNPTCTSGNSIQQPTGNVFSGSSSSLALDSSGNPVVTNFFYQSHGPPGYYVESDLLIAHCSDPNCAGIKPTPIATWTPTDTPPPTTPQAVGGVSLDGHVGSGGTSTGVWILTAAAVAFGMGAASLVARRRTVRC